LSTFTQPVTLNSKSVASIESCQNRAPRPHAMPLAMMVSPKL
jgi:hypothetical protein